MTNQQAAIQAKKRWGKKAYARNSGFMSSPERRAEASQTVRAAIAEIKRIDDEVAARLKELDWYQSLQAKRRDCRDQIRKHEGDAMHYRFHVGRQTSFGFNEVLGSGDTWEEAFAKADEREGRSAA